MPTAQDIRHRLMELVEARGPTKTICPSEVARSLQPDGWRSLMPAVRRQAKQLVHEGNIDITQGGKVVDPQHARGPIRLRLKKSR